MRKIALSTIVLSVPRAAQAHGSAPDTPSWTFDPWIVVPLGVFALMYGIGRLVLARKGRKRIWQDFVCVAGWLALVGALVSPLHWLGERLLIVSHDRTRDPDGGRRRLCLPSHGRSGHCYGPCRDTHGWRSGERCGIRSPRGSGRR